MCGIAGFCGDLADSPQARPVLDGMVLSIAHRGPDGRSHWFGAGIALGHARLSIIDIEGGSQPMTSADGRYVIVFNGEVYNYRELERDLVSRGYVFQTHSDTEVIAAAIDAWGIERGLRSLRGMFAFALYDKRNRSLLLARDRVGIKPLYWTSAGGSVLFASEQKALLATGLVPARINPVAIHDYLATGYASTPATCFAGIEQLEPGTWLEITLDGARRSGRYWSWSPSEEFTGTVDEAATLVRDTLEDAVSGHLISDVGVGAFLSGGLDSSLIVALLSRSQCRPRTFSVGFGDADYDESGPARRVAEWCGADHHELKLADDSGDPDLLRTIVEQYDEPFGDSSCIPTYLMCREVRKYVKVVLSGDGGDEVLGGYVRYLNARRLAVLGRLNRGLTLLNPVVDFAAGHLGRTGQRVGKLWNFAQLDAPDRIAALQTYYSEADRLAIYHNGFAQAALVNGPTSSRLDLPVSETNGNAGQLMIAAEIRLRLHADYLRKVDVASSAHGLEVRVPFLDNRMLDLAARLPMALKVSLLGNTKLLARRIAKTVLPPEISRRSKQGFSIPLDRWAGPTMREYFRDLLLGPSNQLRELLDENAVAEIWRQFDSPADHEGLSRYQRYQRVFLLVSLELWLRRWRPSLT